MTDQTIKRKIQPRWIIVALFVIIALVATVLYFNKAKKEFAEGMAAYESSDCVTAFQNFKRVTTFYKLASSSNISQAQVIKEECGLLNEAEDKRNKGDYEAALDTFKAAIISNSESIHTESINAKIAETYMEWGDSLAKTKNFEGAVEKYHIVLTKYKDQPTAPTAATQAVTVYLKWGDALTQEADYEGAVEKYHIILTEYKDQTTVLTAVTQVAIAYLKWGDSLAQAADYEGAVEKYHIILTEYKDQPPAQIAYKNILVAYNAWGQQLIEEKSFLAAMDVYTDANVLDKESTMQAKFEDGYQTALQALITDTGKDGKAVIAAAIKTACAGQSAFSSAVGASKDKRAGLCSGTYTLLPKNWQATTPGNLRYVISIEHTKEVIEWCRYSGFSGGATTAIIQRFVPLDTIFVYDSISGAVINKKDVRGTDPRSCPPSIIISVIPPKDLIGIEPSEDEIRDAIIRLLSPLLPAP